MRQSILAAIRDGHWDYEPEEVAVTHFDATPAMPGSVDKLEVLAQRLELGLPLWHPRDRTDYEDTRALRD